MTSVYGRNGFEKFIERTINSNAVLYVNKSKSQNLYRQMRVQFPHGLTTLGFDKIIHQSNNVVKQYSDRDYMAAVERGDTETAQKMVDEYAKAKGYSEKVYHGTNAEFTIFEPGLSSGIYMVCIRTEKWLRWCDHSQYEGVTRFRNK